ncbi:MAG: hypothetical protein K5978_04525 [Campylobacter sp.]|nr:hypothetical protein [Campylobacter sp.]
MSSPEREKHLKKLNELTEYENCFRLAEKFQDENFEVCDVAKKEFYLKNLESFEFFSIKAIAKYLNSEISKLEKYDFKFEAKKSETILGVKEFLKVSFERFDDDAIAFFDDFDEKIFKVIQRALDEREFDRVLKAK